MKLPAAWLCCLLLTSPAWAADTVVSGKVYLERDGKPGRGATDPGLAGRAITSSVSASQSTRIDCTTSTLPDCSPLVHNRCLLRLKKVMWPMASVAASDSALT